MQRHSSLRLSLLLGLSTGLLVVYLATLAPYPQPDGSWPILRPLCDLADLIHGSHHADVRDGVYRHRFRALSHNPWHILPSSWRALFLSALPILLLTLSPSRTCPRKPRHRHLYLPAIIPVAIVLATVAVSAVSERSLIHASVSRVHSVTLDTTARSAVVVTTVRPPQWAVFSPPQYGTPLQVDLTTGDAHPILYPFSELDSRVGRVHAVSTSALPPSIHPRRLQTLVYDLETAKTLPIPTPPTDSMRTRSEVLHPNGVRYILHNVYGPTIDAWQLATDATCIPLGPVDSHEFKEHQHTAVWLQGIHDVTNALAIFNTGALLTFQPNPPAVRLLSSPTPSTKLLALSEDHRTILSQVDSRTMQVLTRAGNPRSAVFLPPSETLVKGFFLGPVGDIAAIILRADGKPLLRLYSSVGRTLAQIELQAQNFPLDDVSIVRHRNSPYRVLRIFGFIHPIVYYSRDSTLTLLKLPGYLAADAADLLGSTLAMPTKPNGLLLLDLGTGTMHDLAIRLVPKKKET